MFVSKLLLPSIAFVALSFGLFGSVYAQDNAAQQLDELKRALQTPISQPESPKPRRTRAIVFDNETASGQAPSSQTSQNVTPTQPSQVAATADTPQTNHPSISDCRQLVTTQAANSKAIPFAIQFAGGSAEVSPASRDVLASIGGLLTTMLHGRCVVIEGHTDISGNYDRNVELSHARANSVATFLMRNHSISGNSIVTFGKGPSEIMPGLDPKNPKNRRVVFRIVG